MESVSYLTTTFVAGLPSPTLAMGLAKTGTSGFDQSQNYKDEMAKLDEEMISFSNRGEYLLAENVRKKIDRLKEKIVKREEQEAAQLRATELEEAVIRREQVLNRLRSEFKATAYALIAEHKNKVKRIQLAGESDRVAIIEEAERSIAAGPRLTPELQHMMKNEKQFAKDCAFSDALGERHRTVTYFKNLKLQHENDLRQHASLQLHKVDKKVASQLEILKQNLFSSMEGLRIKMERERGGMVRLSDLETARTIDKLKACTLRS